MSKDEKHLLEDLMDSLDRLFDRESKVVDVHALLLATAKALAGSEYAPRLEQFIAPLGGLVRKSCTEEERREGALLVTNDLRLFLADVLPFPE